MILWGPAELELMKFTVSADQLTKRYLELAKTFAYLTRLEITRPNNASL